MRTSSCHHRGMGFHEPRIAINRVYTKLGDTGETSLAGGHRVPKDSLRIETYGTVDELNSLVGLAAVTAGEKGLPVLVDILHRIQHELFNLGSILATRREDAGSRQARITPADVAQLETEIDQMNSALPPLRSFSLPGGCRINAELHLCRTVARRAERLCVRLAREEQVPPECVCYLNRLSDAFFVWSRWASQTLGVPEVLWSPNLSTAGQRPEC